MATQINDSHRFMQAAFQCQPPEKAAPFPVNAPPDFRMTNHAAKPNGITIPNHRTPNKKLSLGNQLPFPAKIPALNRRTYWGKSPRCMCFRNEESEGSASRTRNVTIRWRRMSAR